MHISRGFSLIEVLIAIFVLAVGLLGVAALQLSSLSSNSEGYLRSQATALAEDMASRIRSGRESMYIDYAGAEKYVEAWADVDSALDCSGGAPATCGVKTPCTTADVIALDRYQVCSSASALLPAGQVFIVQNGNKATVSVNWLAIGGREDTGEQNTDAAQVNPQCIALANSVGVALDALTNCVMIEVVP